MQVKRHIDVHGRADDLDAGLGEQIVSNSHQEKTT